MDQKLIDRINVLAKKSREGGLTEAEKQEQAQLRARYIAAFRQGMMNTLDQVYIVDEKGNKEKLVKNDTGKH